MLKQLPTQLPNNEYELIQIITHSEKFDNETTDQYIGRLQLCQQLLKDKVLKKYSTSTTPKITEITNPITYNTNTSHNPHFYFTGDRII